MKHTVNLKLDTSKNGIDAVFKPWQFEAVNLLLEAHEDHNSNEMHTRLRARGHDISRASVINFMDSLAFWGLATKKEISGKGGYRGIYKIAETRHELNDKIVNIFCQKMYEAFPEIEWLKDIWEEK